MNLVYFKRFRMEIDLTAPDWVGRAAALEPTADRYRFLTWDDSLLDAFARAKYLSFRRELDTDIFPCLAKFEGCRRLMAEIVKKPGFLPGTTWLAISPPDFTTPGAKLLYCGTVQGVRDSSGLGAIQNLGVVQSHRRCGLGTGLLLRSLAGFHQAGVRRVYLEVSSHNADAIRLYRRIGFKPVRVVYKPVENASEKEDIRR
jgi:ribosomal protein S18 acetylase RimI-like enzyme